MKYISASDSCKPEMRAKVLSHLVDRFTNQNAADANQSQHPVEKSTNQNTCSASRSEFLSEKFANQIPSSANQSCGEPKNRISVVPGADRNPTLSVLIPDTVNYRKATSPVFDQNNNIQPIQTDHRFNDLDKRTGQTIFTRGHTAQNISLTENSGLVKIASPNATTLIQSPVQYIRSSAVPLDFSNPNTTQLASTQVQHVGSALVQSNTANTMNILKSNELLSSIPVQLVGPTNTCTSDSVSSSINTAITTAQSPVQYLNPSATTFASPVNGQLTILVPANVITLSPNGPAVVLACDSSNPSPAGGIPTSSSYQSTDNLNEKIFFNDINQIRNINTDTHLLKNIDPHDINKRNGLTTSEAVKYDSVSTAAATSFKNTNSLIMNDQTTRPVLSDNSNRYSPYRPTVFRQTKCSDEQSVTYSEVPKTLNKYKSNNSDLAVASVISTFGTTVHSHSIAQHRQNISPQIFEFQMDRASSYSDLTDNHNTEFDTRSSCAIESQKSYSANVWRPWSM